MEAFRKTWTLSLSQTLAAKDAARRGGQGGGGDRVLPGERSTRSRLVVGVERGVRPLARPRGGKALSEV
ncbi:hypothetical protein NL676_015240 [Syzygium grande]|nr:hypothetical protein NL676_015240 [Syzygium grande]